MCLAIRIFILALLLSFRFAMAQSWDSLNAQGLQHYKNGAYEKAEISFVLALIEAEANHGRAHDQYITTLSNVGFAQKAMGNFPAAQGTFRTAIALEGKVYPDPSIEKIESMADLASVYSLSAQYDSCEYFLTAAMNLITRAVNERTKQYQEQVSRFFDALVNVQNSLASLHHKRGQFRDAIQLMEQQRQFIQETYPNDYKALGSYRATINNLSTYYLAVGNSQHAKALVSEYVKLAEHADDDPITYLYALQNLGNIYRAYEVYDSAQMVWMKAIATIERGSFYGTEIHLSLLNNLGELNVELENYDAGIQYLIQALKLNEARAGRNPRLYQSTLFNLTSGYLWSGNYPLADQYYSVLMKELLDEVHTNFTYLSESEKIAFYRSQLSILESFYSFALDVSGIIPLQKSQNPYVNRDITKKLYDTHIATKGLILNSTYRLKNQILHGADVNAKANYIRWESLKNKLAQLYRSDDPSSASIGQLTSQIEALEKSLIAQSRQFRQGFVSQPVSWKDVQSRLKKGEAAVEIIRFPGGLIYGALVLTAQTTERPDLALVLSTKTKDLEKQFFKQYINAIAFRQTDTLSYQTYWEPIFRVIQKNLPKGQALTKVYFSPDGIYNQINLNTLFSPHEKKYLLDIVDIHQLTNTRDLVTMSQETPVRKSVALIGDPSFTVNQSSSTQTFNNLTDTREEVDQIAAYFKTKQWRVTLLKDQEASEGAVKKLHSGDILHIASHGFFLNSATDQSASLVQTLLNSGIALAGANNPDADSNNDGILTAYEALSLNLDTTKLVVLSACESGLGEFHPGEGVYGLQRAFQSAGAKRVVMSLWKVDDQATQQLMTGFYKLWLTKIMDSRAAFRQSQQELRTRYPEPYYWGAFIFTGY